MTKVDWQRREVSLVLGDINWSRAIVIISPQTNFGILWSTNHTIAVIIDHGGFLIGICRLNWSSSLFFSWLKVIILIPALFSIFVRSLKIRFLWGTEFQFFIKNSVNAVSIKALLVKFLRVSEFWEIWSTERGQMDPRNSRKEGMPHDFPESKTVPWLSKKHFIDQITTIGSQFPNHIWGQLELPVLWQVLTSYVSPRNRQKSAKLVNINGRWSAL